MQVEDLTGGRFGPIDLVVILDTNSYSQLPQFEIYLKQTDVPILIVDHHVTSDKLGRVEITDRTAAAAGLVLFEFLGYVGWPITKETAEALFVAIATDTGWFHLRNTDSRVFRSCAELIEAGVEPNDLYRRLYQTFSPARFKLMTVMLDRLELHLDGRYASQYLVREDFERTGAAYRDTENLINECQRIGSVVVAALFMEIAGRANPLLAAEPAPGRAGRRCQRDRREIRRRGPQDGRRHLPARSHRARHAIDARRSGQATRRGCGPVRTASDAGLSERDREMICSVRLGRHIIQAG